MHGACSEWAAPGNGAGTGLGPGRSAAGCRAGVHGNRGPSHTTLSCRWGGRRRAHRSGRYWDCGSHSRGRASPLDPGGGWEERGGAVVGVPALCAVPRPCPPPLAAMPLVVSSSGHLPLSQGLLPLWPLVPPGWVQAQGPPHLRGPLASDCPQNKACYRGPLLGPLSHSVGSALVFLAASKICKGRGNGTHLWVPSTWQSKVLAKKGRGRERGWGEGRAWGDRGPGDGGTREHRSSQAG